MSLHNGNANKNGVCLTDPEPDEPMQWVKEPLKLILQVLLLILLIVPTGIWATLKLIFTKQKSLKGQTAMVTGGAHGLGRELCYKLAKLGCSIACVDINDKGSNETVQNIKKLYPDVAAYAYHCDVRSKDEIQKLHEDIKRNLQQVDLLIHNAGDVTSAYLTAFEDKYLDNMIDLNLKSHFLIYREFLPDMLKRNSGHIVAIASLASVYTEVNFSIYTATKHGVLALMESMHLELKQIPNNQVKTTIVCPYFINTNIKYMREWDLRIPGLPMSLAVNEIIKGIRKNKRLISIPPLFYSMAVILRVLPFDICDMVKDILYVRLTPAKQTKLRTD